MFFEPMHLDGPTILGIHLDAWFLGISAAFLLAWLLWVRRITGIEPPDPAIWRYRDDSDTAAWPVEEELVGQRSRPSWVAGAGRVGRRMTMRWLITRLELAVGVVAVGGTALLWAIRPRFMGEGMGQPEWFAWLVPLGLAGALVGLGWMIRIAYRDPEAHPSIWRSSED